MKSEKDDKRGMDFHEIIVLVVVTCLAIQAQVAILSAVGLIAGYALSGIYCLVAIVGLAMYSYHRLAKFALYMGGLVAALSRLQLKGSVAEQFGDLSIVVLSLAGMTLISIMCGIKVAALATELLAYIESKDRPKD